MMGFGVIPQLERKFSTVQRHLWMSLRAAAFGFRRRGNLRGVEITQEREIASPKTGSQ
jgi:hypothetical protein